MFCMWGAPDELASQFGQRRRRKSTNAGSNDPSQKSPFRRIAAERSHRENSVGRAARRASGNRAARDSVGNYVLPGGFNLLRRENISHHLA